MTTIRSYDPQDESLLRDIAIQNYVGQLQDSKPVTPDNPELQAYLAHIIQTQESGKGIILLAERDNRLIGFVCLQRPDNTTSENGNQGAYAFVSDLFVLPEYRHQGVGSLLNRKLEEQARVLGATNVALRVAADNKEAREFYINEQYQDKFVVMSKDLSGQ